MNHVKGRIIRATAGLVLGLGVAVFIIRWQFPTQQIDTAPPICYSSTGRAVSCSGEFWLVLGFLGGGAVSVLVFAGLKRFAEAERLPSSGPRS